NIRDGAKWRYRRDAAGARGERAQADGGFHPCPRSRRLLEEEFGGRRGSRGARSVLEYSVHGLRQIRPGQGRDLYLALSRRDGLDQAHPGARGRAFPDRAGRQGGGDEKERQIFLLSPRRLADRRLAVFPSIALGQRRAEADRCTRGLPKFAVPHGDIAPEDRSDRPALHIAAGKGRPTTFRGDPVVGDGLLQFQIDDGEIGVIAYRDAALAGDAEDALRPGAGQIDEAGKAEPPFVDMVQHHRNQGLHARHAGGRGWVRRLLLLKRVRGVIRAQNIDHALIEPPPKHVLVRLVSKRRGYLRPRTDRRI